jgi:excinuclease ABC subunit A
VDEKEKFYSEHLYSHKSGKSYRPLEPRLFSFNSPLGACEMCNGLGRSKVFIEEKYIDSMDKSFDEGAILPLASSRGFYYQMVKSILKTEGISNDTPLKKWPKKLKTTIFEGSSKEYTYNFVSENSQYTFSKPFPGIASWLEKKYHESGSEKVRTDLEEYMHIQTCPECNGQRLNAYARSVKVSEHSLMDICELSIEDSCVFFKELKFTGNKKIIANKVLKEINARLSFLREVGLTYLTLNRSANTLSGGEAQRIRLATQIGSALSGVLYVLDEPSIGLHQRDNDKLILTLKRLRDLGNTVIVVEHDEDTMRNSDFIVDIGPGAGVHGGQIVAMGTLKEILKTKTVTANFLSKKEKIELPQKRRSLKEKVTLKGINVNNLKNLDVTIPLEGLVCITGVSGSGKSSLIHQALVPGAKNALLRTFQRKTFIKKLMVWKTLIKSLRLISHPLEELQNQTPQLIQNFLMKLELYLLIPMKRRCVAIKQDASRLMLKEEGVRPARATELSNLK